MDELTGTDTSRRRRAWPAWPVLVGIIAFGVLLVVALFVATPVGIDRTPGDDSVSVGFARDMAVHHAQAVEMAELIRHRTQREEIRQLAVDIALTQQFEIGQLNGWLDAWGLSPNPMGPRMAWMGMATDDDMPGMATRTEVNELVGAEGVDADRLFLEMMIEHHQGGVHMGEVAAVDGELAQVRRVAQAMVDAQRLEIDYMRTLLDAPEGNDEGRPDHDGNGDDHQDDDGS